MEILITLAMKFWQWSILIALIIIGFIINLFDKKVDSRVNFKYKDYAKVILLKNNIKKRAR